VKYPRVVPIGPSEAKLLKDRTLIKLYNYRPTWLANSQGRGRGEPG